MGEIGGFLKYCRKDPEYRKVEDRLKDFDPVEMRQFDSEIHIQAARCMDCGTPFCHGCGCPLATVIPELTDLVFHDRWQEALDVLISTNNFPEFTARICPALCEASCVLGINDDPATIRQVELAIIRRGFVDGYLQPRPPVIRYDEKIAVIGSGPAGLSVADSLNRTGYCVTVYDKSKNPGGILRYGIPDFKLGKRIVDRRIKLMRDEGVMFELGITVGDDVSYNYLKNRFDAVCLSGGSREPRDISVPGRKLKGIYFAMDYLVQQNKRLEGERIEKEDEITAEGKTVVIIGGGDTGSDCLGTALRQRANKVYQFEIMPKPPEERPENTPWPMWPNVIRESSSHKEGGERRWCVATKEFTGENGKVKSIRCVEVEWSHGHDGRMEFKEKPGTDFDMDVQLVLLSMGFVGPGRNRIVEDLHIEHDSKGNIKVNENHMTSVDGIFAAGDMAQGQSLVVRAIADGRMTASGIVQYLEKKRGKNVNGNKQ
ncbi:MAG: glutamate synthase subunit beta [Kiritimatiellae bacterium]|nr:glutamate synthase subunit beta [Kiritimatiellia bacterium]MDD5519438.1 glutamate synthase subunit beta [Kiritimatiellia bacterium]